MSCKVMMFKKNYVQWVGQKNKYHTIKIPATPPPSIM